MRIKYEIVPGGRLPEKKVDSAGWDLYAREGVVVPVGKIVIVPAGFKMLLERGWEAQIRARSSLAFKGILIANGVGTIDWDHPDEVGIILLNMSGHEYVVESGARIAQMLFARVEDVEWEAGPVGVGVRKGGFGSTGV